MAKRRVIVRGGGNNLYYVSDSSGVFYVSKSNGTDIGKARNLDDALAIIKSHSGREIEKIE